MLLLTISIYCLIGAMVAYCDYKYIMIENPWKKKYIAVLLSLTNIILWLPVHIGVIFIKFYYVAFVDEE